MKISKSRNLENRQGVMGFDPVEVSTSADLEGYVCLDWSPSVFKVLTEDSPVFAKNQEEGNKDPRPKGWRDLRPFLGQRYKIDDMWESSDWLFGDVDNGPKDEDSCTIEEFERLFDEYEYYLIPSRNHRKPKNGHPAADRFHVLFPQPFCYASITELRRDLQNMQEEYKFFDKGSLTAHRFFFGVPGVTVTYHKGKPYTPKAPTPKPDTNADIERGVKAASREYSPQSKRAAIMEALKKAAVNGEFDSYGDWVNLGGALRSCGYSFEDWVDLSWGGDQKLSPDQIKRKWESFNFTKYTEGSLVTWGRLGDPDLLMPKIKIKKDAEYEAENAPPSDAIEAACERLLTNPTHDEAAHLIHLITGDSVVYEKQSATGGEFFITNGITWEPKPAMCVWVCELLKSHLQDTADRIVKEFQDAGDNSTAQATAQQFMRAQAMVQSYDFVSSSLKFFRDRVIVNNGKPIEWNKTPEVFVCKDGIVDFSGKTSIIRTPRPGEFFRTPIDCRVVDIVDGGKADYWHEFLGALFPNADTLKSALHCIALTVSGAPSKTFQIWTNTNDGGKDTLFAALSKLLPGYSKMLTTAIILKGGDGSERRFGLAELQGLRGAFFNEPLGVFDMHQIKSLTSLSQIQGERKGKDPVHFNQTWSVVALCNQLPRFGTDDNAFFQRLFVLPFYSVFYSSEASKIKNIQNGIEECRLKKAKEKEEILANIEKERAAILHELIDAWRDCRDNYGKKPYSSAECADAASAYQDDNDMLGTFFNEYFERGGHYDTVMYDRIRDCWLEYLGDKFAKTRFLFADLKKKFKFLEQYRTATGRGFRYMKERDPNEERIPF